MSQSATPADIKKAPGVRARVRAELTAEIKRAAREQLAVEGAASLSLRAIARELGMASSAIYRYFASREELLTALIIDAYDSVGAAVEAAEARCARADLTGRFVAVATSIRAWAHSNPHEYALIYGSPVPGYAAPVDTIDPATRVSVTLLTILVDGFSGEEMHADREAELGASLAELHSYVGHRIPPRRLAQGVEAWAEIFGLVSLELFGHFNNVISDPDLFFDHAVRSLAARTLDLAD